MRATDAMRSSIVVFVLIFAGCGETLPKATIPELAETLSVHIILYNETGSKIICQGVVKDKIHVQEIRECLIPNEYSKSAAGLMRSGPVIGKVGIKGPQETTWIEFVDSGKNPLCFQIGENAYLRGGVGYEGYLGDHKRLYGIDSEDVAESKLFYEKLLSICK